MGDGTMIQLIPMINSQEKTKHAASLACQNGLMVTVKSNPKMVSFTNLLKNCCTTSYNGYLGATWDKKNWIWDDDFGADNLPIIGGQIDDPYILWEFSFTTQHLKFQRVGDTIHRIDIVVCEQNSQSDQFSADLTTTESIANTTSMAKKDKKPWPVIIWICFGVLGYSVIHTVILVVCDYKDNQKDERKEKEMILKNGALSIDGDEATKNQAFGSKSISPKIDDQKFDSCSG